MCAVKGGQ